MIKGLIKIAYILNQKGLKTEAQELEEMIESLAKRVGLKVDELVSVANHFDAVGKYEVADRLDEMVKEAKTKYKEWKGKGTDKPPHKHRPKPPKAWFNKMKAEVKKENPDYSAKRVEEIVGDIWHNELSDKKVENIMKKKASGKWFVFVSWGDGERGGTEFQGSYDTKEEAEKVADYLKQNGQNAEVEFMGKES